MRRFASLGLPISVALLLLAGLIVAISAVNDVRSRASSPDIVIRRYFAALQAGDADDALAALTPAARARDAAFVANGVNNTYRIVGIAVRSSSVLDRLGGSPAGPIDATIFVEVEEAVSGAAWSATPRVPLTQADGHWYLARAPLAPE
jgi:hypothetical protein